MKKLALVKNLFSHKNKVRPDNAASVWKESHFTTKVADNQLSVINTECHTVSHVSVLFDIMTRPPTGGKFQSERYSNLAGFQMRNSTQL